MEWVLVLAVLACPIGMLAMGAIAWMIGKRAAHDSERAHDAHSENASAAREASLTPGP